MIDPGFAAVFAALVALAIGVANLLRSAADARRTAKREQIRRRAEAYVDLLRVVERRGLAVQDEMYNYTETESDELDVAMPKRSIEKLPRSDRAEALALATAYGTPAVREAVDNWVATVDAWETRRDGYEFDWQTGPREALEHKDAEPERTNESAARKALGEAVSAALKSDL